VDYVKIRKIAYVFSSVAFRIWKLAAMEINGEDIVLNMTLGWWESYSRSLRIWRYTDFFGLVFGDFLLIL